MRYAIVRNAESRRRAEAYLPSNYEVVAAVARVGGTEDFVIAGRDEAGWTLEGYVIPRYASGLIWASEIDESEVCDHCGALLVEGHCDACGGRQEP